MKTTELRIGNWIYKRSSTGVKNAIQMNSFYGLCNVRTNSEKFEPIQLDEEWLRKFGFDDSEYKDGYIGIDVNNSNFVLSKPKKYEFMKNYLWEYKADMWQKYVELQYVHQLQNLFFVLTGKELTIKDDK